MTTGDEFAMFCWPGVPAAQPVTQSTSTGVARSSASVRPEPPAGNTTGMRPLESAGNLPSMLAKLVDCVCCSASVEAPVGNGSAAALIGCVACQNVPVTATDPVTVTAPVQRSHAEPSQIIRNPP